MCHQGVSRELCGIALYFFCGKGGQCIACQTVGRPFIHGDGTLCAVKCNGRFVPVKTSPFQPTASLGNGDLRKRFQQRLADALTAVFIKNEQVFQIDASTSEPCGKIIEKQRE